MAVGDLTAASEHWKSSQIGFELRVCDLAPPPPTYTPTHQPTHTPRTALDLLCCPRRIHHHEYYMQGLLGERQKEWGLQ